MHGIGAAKLCDALCRTHQVEMNKPLQLPPTLLEQVSGTNIQVLRCLPPRSFGTPSGRLCLTLLCRLRLVRSRCFASAIGICVARDAFFPGRTLVAQILRLPSQLVSSTATSLTTSVDCSFFSSSVLEIHNLGPMNFALHMPSHMDIVVGQIEFSNFEVLHTATAPPVGTANIASTASVAPPWYVRFGL